MEPVKDPRDKASTREYRKLKLRDDKWGGVKKRRARPRLWIALADLRVGVSGYLQPEVLLGRNWSSGSSPT
jgi:hypothetical protein